ncbi:MAG: D-tyrosyl-tRNA(Tyr) deacylase [Deltaproteobacteria bacterium]|nr:D-tyrosyl-tRNA(Tyr) deacylase [Deltaproteobacteria bacterium]
MRAVVQRVARAEVRVEGRVIGSIGKGLLAYIGVERGDGPADIEFISTKLRSMRVFEDSNNRMNLDVGEIKGGFLIISQFTLHGDLRKGRRPSFDAAEEPGRAQELYGALIRNLSETGLTVEAGSFGAHMEVDSVNDGPVTMLLDSRKIF